MSDAPQGPGWWLASDGRWYPPEAVPGPIPGATPGEGDAVGWGAPQPSPSAGDPAPWAAPGSAQPQPQPQPAPWAAPGSGQPQPAPAPWAAPGQPGGPYQPGQPPGWTPPPGQPPVFAPSKPSNGPGIASLILGILGILSFWIFIGGLLGLIGLILGIVGIRKAREIDNGKGISIAGTILSALAIIGAILMVALIAWVVDNGEELFGEADPSTYSITVESCSVANGQGVAFGTIANTTDQDRRFLVSVDISGDGDTTNTSTVLSLDPRQDSTWQVTTATTASEVTCSPPSVRRALQRD